MLHRFHAHHRSQGFIARFNHGTKGGHNINTALLYCLWQHTEAILKFIKMDQHFLNKLKYDHVQLKYNAKNSTIHMSIEYVTLNLGSTTKYVSNTWIKLVS